MTLILLALQLHRPRLRRCLGLSSGLEKLRAVRLGHLRLLNHGRRSLVLGKLVHPVVHRQLLPLLAAQLGAAFFDDKLSAMCIGWLRDCVYAIREAAITNLRKLIDVFGVEWGLQHVVPQVLEAHTHTNYLYRMTVLYAIVSMAPAVGPTVVASTLLPMTLHLANDAVPNVRFNAAKTLRQLTPMIEPGLLIERVKPCLTTLADDPDADVSYFAVQALQGC